MSLTFNRIRERVSFELGKEIEKDGFRLVTSVGQKKNFFYQEYFFLPRVLTPIVLKRKNIDNNINCHSFIQPLKDLRKKTIKKPTQFIIYEFILKYLEQYFRAQ